MTETRERDGKIYTLVRVTKFEQDARAFTRGLQECGKWAFFTQEGRLRKVWCVQ